MSTTENSKPFPSQRQKEFRSKKELKNTLKDTREQEALDASIRKAAALAFSNTKPQPNFSREQRRLHKRLEDNANKICIPLVEEFMDYSVANANNKYAQEQRLLKIDKRWEDFLRKNKSYNFNDWSTYFIERVQQTRSLMLSVEK